MRTRTPLANAAVFFIAGMELERSRTVCATLQHLPWKLFSTHDPYATLRNGEEGRRRAGPEEGEEVGREEVMGLS